MGRRDNHWFRFKNEIRHNIVSVFFFLNQRTQLTIVINIIEREFVATALLPLNRHTPSGQSRVHRVTQLRTDGVHCREYAGTGPVVLKVVPVTGAAILQVTMDQLMCTSLPHTHYWYEVGMLIEWHGVCIVSTYSKLRINRVRLPIPLVVS